MKMPDSITPFKAIDDLGRSFIGLQLYQLLAVINIQGNELLKREDVGIPSRIASSLMLISMNGPQSVTQLGACLNMSHQLMAHRVKSMKDLNLVVEVKDPDDKRRRLLHLTGSGKKTAKKLQKIMGDAEKAYADVSKEIGLDIYEALLKTRDALLTKPLYKRIEDE